MFTKIKKTTHNNGYNSLWWIFLRKITTFKSSLGIGGMVLAYKPATILIETRNTQLKIKNKELTILDHLKHIHICHCFYLA
jgi:hypothetical protein